MNYAHENMKDLIIVKNASYIRDKVIELVFSDGLRSQIDFSPWIERYPFFAPLKDEKYFRNFDLDGSTIVWPNGADIAPETLYDLAVAQAPLQKA